MNKRFFTLLAGIFLMMFAVTFSANAQMAFGPSTKADSLRIGKPVQKLKVGDNPGYYHLRVTKIGSKKITADLDSAVVLYMGKEDPSGQYRLFIDSLNRARGTYATEFSTNSKAEESAAALWCVSITEFEQGHNPIFDFTNKQQKQRLEVDMFDYESWKKSDKDTTPGVMVRVQDSAKLIVPGGVSGWEFSLPYATVLDADRPLISYVDRDSVAVLCLNRDSVRAKVVVKVASARDVQDGKVNDVLYFTLTEATPFIVNVTDYNTYFGTKTAGTANLTFNPNGANNPFINQLTAASIALTDTLFRYRAKFKRDTAYLNNTVPTLGADRFSTDTIHGAILDSLGYMTLKSGSKFVSVMNEYLPGNTGNTQFLKLGVADKYDKSQFGKQAFRLIYYPSGDSIYINAYQATYLPTYDNDVMTKFHLKNAMTPWKDSMALAVFTYYADSSALQHPDSVYWGAAPDSFLMMTARLKYGFNKDSATFLEPYNYYHRLYVALQNLNAGPSVTLHTNNFGNHNTHAINTQINFNLYRSCANDDRQFTTIAPNLYLIRNEKGQYLHVPLHSPTDSASWITLEPNVHPELLPSFQWVVEKRYANSEVSPVVFTNREFAWQDYTVQLDKKPSKPFAFRLKNPKWNNEKVNANVVTFGNHVGNTATFIALPTQYKSDELMGYTWINPDTSMINLYAFNYINALSDKKYLGVTDPRRDSVIYADYDNKYTKMYFRLDTIKEPIGELSEYGFDASKTKNVEGLKDLVTLKRQVYRLSYEDPFKMTCANPVGLGNGEDKQYLLKSNTNYKKFFGKPAFYLRHVYHQDMNGTLVPNFALVQRIDESTWAPGASSSKAEFLNYINEVYGAQAKKLLDSVIKHVPEFNYGIFTAKVAPATGKLHMALRVEGTTPDVFRLEKDADPIYRRFNTEAEGVASDAPDTLHFYQHESSSMYLFENTGAINTQHKYWRYDHNGKKYGGKNYAGSVNYKEVPNVHTAIFVDTAYVNRGTGYIKPQYLLAVDPRIVVPGQKCDEEGNIVDGGKEMGYYVRARYMINANDSAYKTASDKANGKGNHDYLWDTQWTRFIFTDAIHANDYLYILGELGNNTTDRSLDNIELVKAGLVTPRMINGVVNKEAIDLVKLDAYAVANPTKIRRIFLGNNWHKDCVFQFRLVERGATDFTIESATSERLPMGTLDNVTDSFAGPQPKFAPCQGEWLKVQNEVPTTSQSDITASQGQSGIFQVRKAGGEGLNLDPNPLANDNVAKVTVVGDKGTVTILNAAGKSVVINNILGQTVARVTLTSDNQSVQVPSGVVIVSVDGEETVKALVK